ncbi:MULTISPECIES: dihydrolipoyllysine-residue succinyltransferase [Xanthomonas translucens group]|jgi:2-oxoglutarate dehydrogenase E2 component (dihydrolipoamide succinyltransferase)|uniref:Dihydrolipoyllysine-residue succinyltransferase component of 2-oxoglutarate dehydrogenase complex n=7 Tax=Xanthomonas translucens group TaxID=3390202 RepID=A0A120EXH6_XANCT|nr:dihydrolipoyllysine-residue succinyltransferase [Xanthomonas translucens]EKU24482.1 dihydrolipoamide S-succinyltransferase [Xanthomonas translucens pv. graminis ART-Xtg29]KWV14492.1 dihydrolipoamide succinyltransferase [Xanthomonas translucens]MCC8446487.1 dihydrolipoyllysine-residue succinyltransferase [Xanthomonas translucens pv. translucens]MCT8287427.1 dihydrolipoyllysine-residue succinyltransferase [Xanthomonas translucens pv. translucens]MCT8305085.1 dihydrolipoyllysine-residue succin
MATEVKVPVLPESVSDATIASWHKKAGDAVKRDENLVDLETDKVVLEVPSPVDGVLKEIKFEAGATVTSSQLLAIIEEGATAAAAPAAAKVADAPAPEAPKAAAAEAPKAAKVESAKAAGDVSSLPPGARFSAITEGVDPAQVDGTGRRGAVTKEDILNYAKNGGAGKAAGARPEERVAMTRVRKRIAERLMQSKNSTAMLTTFNEVNLAKVSAARKELQDEFQKAHGIKLGFMSFFVKAAANALQRFPLVNASIDGEDIIYHGYSDISIAVSTEKGLVTPVLRNVERQSFAEIEKGIADYAKKARDGKLSLEELQGGTFTVTNGGTFGSLLSTPIINPPQSAILGMHAIKERPIAENGQVVIAPMMFLALSYDHRIIDGKDSVQFLVDIKNQLENPGRMLFGL